MNPRIGSQIDKSQRWQNGLSQGVLPTNDKALLRLLGLVLPGIIVLPALILAGLVHLPVLHCRKA